MENFINIISAGAYGDGKHDDAEIINEIIQKHHRIFIPAGEYMLADTLRLPSHTVIKADADAHIFRREHTQTGRGDFLLTNEDTASGNEDITIIGGTWDGNCCPEDRGDDLFDQSSTTGVLLNFRKVRKLSISDATLKNPLTYYTRFCEVDGAVIERIKLASERISGNQDGIHIAGGCRNFVIRDINGTYGSPNDDFIALNADDAMQRQECFDTVCGDIENITVENIHSDMCHCFVRLLSVNSEIKNIVIRNVSGSCKTYCVNLDAARGCRTPLFSDTDRPCGVGHISDIIIENLNVSHASHDPFVALESNCTNFRISDFTNTGDSGEIFVALTHLDTCEYELISDKKSEKKALSCGSTEIIRADRADRFYITKKST